MSIRELIQRIPPPQNPKDSKVNWDAYENHMGFRPPEYFCDLIRTYGDCIWFATIRLLYTTAHSADELNEYTSTLKLKATQMKGNIYSPKPFEEITPPLYPEPNGLMAFAIDYSSNIFCWKTEGNPENWPIAIWKTGELNVFERSTAPNLLLDWMNRERQMVDLFCDYNEISEDWLPIEVAR